MMRLPGAASAALRPLTRGPGRPARWLGTARTALYLSLPAAAGDQPGPPAVLVILTREAPRLPCGLRLATTAAELPLTSLAPDLPGGQQAPAVIGDGRVEWPGPGGQVVITVASEWAPAAVTRGMVSAAALARAEAAAPGRVPGVAQPLLNALREAVAPPAGAGARPGAGDPAGDDPAGGGLGAADPAGSRLGAGDPAGNAVAALLGRGGGLTPSGDDVLAGFLAGARAFGLPAAGVRQAVNALAPAATTALSARLLRHAADGECIDEVAALTRALTGQGDAATAVWRLAGIGHSSGAALARGLLLAAACTLQPAAAPPAGPGPARQPQAAW